jgi:type II secretory ATPase GspE/PulE/Tfp pilus assembly ATPase PilB-like protein
MGYSVRRFIVSHASLEHAWERYKDLSFATETEAGILTLSNDTIMQMLERLKTMKDVQVEIADHAGSKDTHRISRVLEIIMAGALSLGASDVHMEPEEKDVRMRYRLDGVLVEAATFDQSTYALISSRLKLLSGLKLNVKNAAQDGRFSIVVHNKEIEIRASVLPGAYAETIVMRVLDPSTIALPMEALGFDKYLMALFQREIAKPNGMILNTGPTGSGKTTTLYAFLRQVSDPTVKVVTIEDPIEYHLPGVVQTQVSKDYTFALGLRSTLRQDPDVIMVGEIRDSETAKLAFQAALTGHLVLSTIHTNDAVGTIPRLIDMGVEPYLIPPVLILSIAQRLVRTLYPGTGKAVSLSASEKESIQAQLATLPEQYRFPIAQDVYEPERSAESATGMKGRMAVFEVLEMSTEIERIILENPIDSKIWSAARAQGMLTMREDAIVKAFDKKIPYTEVSTLSSMMLGADEEDATTPLITPPIPETPITEI